MPKEKTDGQGVEVGQPIEGKTAFVLEMEYLNGFLTSKDNQFKLLCPVQMVNGSRVKIVAVVPKDAKIG